MESALSEKGVSEQIDRLADLAAASSRNFETATVAGVGPVERTAAGVAVKRIGDIGTVVAGFVALTAWVVAVAVESTAIAAAAKLVGNIAVDAVGFEAETASVAVVLAARIADRADSVCVVAPLVAAAAQKDGLAAATWDAVASVDETVVVAFVVGAAFVAAEDAVLAAWEVGGEAVELDCWCRQWTCSWCRGS